MTDMNKTNYSLLITIVSLLIICDVSLCQSNLYQVLYYDAYVPATKEHKIRSRISTTNFLNTVTTITNPTKVILKRSTESNDQPVTIIPSDGNGPIEENRKYIFFFPELKGYHKLNRMFIAKNITCTAGTVSYDLKFYLCINDLNTDFTAIPGTNKLKYNGSIIENPNNDTNTLNMISMITSNFCS